MRLTLPAHSKRRILLAVASGVSAVLMVLLVQWFAPSGHDAKGSNPSLSRTAQAGPPWIYGRADARFTLVEYADLECSYCGKYFPVLQRWIAEHPEVNWQWHHLPLRVHEPAATRAARIAECAGEVGGNTAFWNAVAWINQHTRGGGAGLPTAAPFPGMSPTIQACLQSNRPDAVIQAQTAAAVRDKITVTPTLRLVDHHTGKTLILHGLVEGDALLSAIDLLVAPSNEVAHAAE